MNSHDHGVFTRTQHSLARLAVAGLALVTVSVTSRVAAGDQVAAPPVELRRIMRQLGMDMQTVTDGISREDWEQVATTAPKIAEHPQPPLTEKMRILGFLGGDADRFRRFDGQTHEAAVSLGRAATRGDGQAVISSFAALQSACLGCHQQFRKTFVEHFYGQR